MQEPHVIVIEPGDLVLIGGCADSATDAHSIEEIRKALPDAKGVFGFEGHISVQVMHGEVPNG